MSVISRVATKGGICIAKRIEDIQDTDLLSVPEYPLYLPVQGLQFSHALGGVSVQTRRAGNASVAQENPISQAFEGIARVLPGYVKRQTQLELSEKIWEARLGTRILIAEAGVGTGKSFAYLVPSLLKKAGFPWMSGPLVISTKTIALQEQLYKKDIPFLLSALGIKRDILLAKGKYNYLCRRRLTDALAKDSDNEELEHLNEWTSKVAGNSLNECERFGDKSWAPGVSAETWGKICVARCSESRCPMSPECGYMLYRRRRRQARDIIVVNHDLLVADLRVREQGGALWYTPGMLVIDEAHGLESAVQLLFGHRFSKMSILLALDRAAGNREIAWHLSPRAVAKAKSHVMKFFDMVYESLDPVEECRVVCWKQDLAVQAGQTLGALKEISGAIQVVSASLERTARGEFFEEIEEQITEAELALELYEQNDSGFVAYVEGKDFVVSPLEVGPLLNESLWSRSKGNYPVVLLSGTLAVQGNLEYICKKLGLDLPDNSCRLECQVYPSPFDFENRVRIYVPEHMPRPRHDEQEDEEFIRALASEIEKLVYITQGRALVLFTSYRRMNAVYDLLKEKELPGRLFCQGKELPSYRLLEVFRQDVNSILLATGTFWEGIDAQGETLTLVVMDKLPFPSPNEPLTYGRHERVKVSGGDAFREVALPEMLLQLRQGAGRLIRHEEDWGIIAVLDPRAAKDYRKLVEEALPPAPWVKDIRELVFWYDNFVANTRALKGKP